MSKNKHFLLPVIALGIFSAHAAEVPVNAAVEPEKKLVGQNKPEAAVEKVVVSGTSDVRRSSTTALTVMNREEINRYGDSNIAEVLNRLPGISLNERPGSGKEIRMRGLSSAYTQILLNGDPAPQGFALDSLSPSMVERIEVSRSATAEQGGRAVAGTINIILKTQVSKSESEIKTGLTYDAERWSPNLSGQISGSKDEFSYILPLSVAQNRALRNSYIDEKSANAGQLTHTRIEQQRNSKNEQLNFSPRLSWKWGADDQLALKSFFDHLHSLSTGSDVGTNLVGPAQDYPSSEKARGIAFANGSR